ncbi:MAG TPA: methionine--tRNA ligase subunit beta, partial [Rhabdochlamydiaceae bacterium]|nr:methionine--tRNA ligase subunit beta [Rhabdochlamydiaceae bacterium]
FKQFSADQIRYYLAANAPESQDAEFSWKDFQARCNSELLGKFGNLANRTLVFAQVHCGGKVPAMNDFDKEDEIFIERLGFLSEKIRTSFEQFHLRKACQEIMELAQAGNVFFDAKKPWLLAKDPNRRAEMNTVIACCLECLKVLALVAFPVIPHAAGKLWRMLGFEHHLEKKQWRFILEDKIPTGQVLANPEILFRRVEDETIENEIAKLKKPKKEKMEQTTTQNTEISFDEFKKVDLRVAQILAAEKVAKSNKLLKLSVDLGTETRTIVSGIAHYFENPEQLIGKKIVVVANLKPVKLMGIESQGMVLTALHEGGLELLNLEKAKPGERIS